MIYQDGTGQRIALPFFAINLSLANCDFINDIRELTTLVYLATQVRQSNQMQRQQISTEQKPSMSTVINAPSA
jgi:hypothetical protein